MCGTSKTWSTAITASRAYIKVVLLGAAHASTAIGQSRCSSSAPCQAFQREKAQARLRALSIL